MAEENNIDDYLKGKRAGQRTFGPSDSTIERMAALDPEFAEELERMKSHWLGEANQLLKDMMIAIGNKVKDKDATLKDIAKALDIVSNKYNVFLGLPTSLSAHAHVIKTQEPKDLTEEELDTKIEQLQTQLDFQAIGEKQNEIIEVEAVRRKS